MSPLTLEPCAKALEEGHSIESHEASETRAQPACHHDQPDVFGVRTFLVAPEDLSVEALLQLSLFR